MDPMPTMSSDSGRDHVVTVNGQKQGSLVNKEFGVGQSIPGKEIGQIGL